MKNNNKNVFKKAFGQEKLPINPFKRAKVKKRNAQKKLAFQIMLATTAAGTAAGAGIGFGTGVLVGRRGKKKVSVGVDNIEDEAGDDTVYGGVGENGDKIEGTPPPEQGEPDIYAVGIFPGTGPDCRVFDVAKDDLRYGLCFNGDESFDDINDIMAEFEMEDADLLELVYDFSMNNAKIERVKASICSFCAKESVPVVLLDSSRHEVLIQRVDENGYIIDEDVLGATEPGYTPKPVPKPAAKKIQLEEEDPYAGMNNLTDQSQIGQDYPEDLEDDDDDDDDDPATEIDRIVAKKANERVGIEPSIEQPPKRRIRYPDGRPPRPVSKVVEDAENGNSELVEESDDSSKNFEDAEPEEVQAIVGRLLEELPEDLDEYGECSVKEEFFEKMDYNRDAFVAMFFRTYRGTDPFNGKKDPELSGTIISKVPDGFNTDGVHIFFIDQALKVYAMYCKKRGIAMPDPDDNTIIKGDIRFIDLAYSIQTMAIKIYKRSHDGPDMNKVYKGFLRDLGVRLMQDILRTRIRIKRSMEQYAKDRAYSMENTREILTDEYGQDPTEEPDPEDLITPEQEAEQEEQEKEEPEEVTEPAE